MTHDAQKQIERLVGDRRDLLSALDAAIGQWRRWATDAGTDLETVATMGGSLWRECRDIYEKVRGSHWEESDRYDLPSGGTGSYAGIERFGKAAQESARALSQFVTAWNMMPADIRAALAPTLQDEERG